MSRCFPFPPPGYEKKARTDDTDLLTKEKRKEKKHKKDKKDKEKREGQEKNDKGRSKDKHKEKKDRKEKHKEKKDKDRDKDKTLISADKKVEKQPECYNGDNVGQTSRQSVEIEDSKHVQELARRIKDEDRATGSQMVQNAVMDQRRAILLAGVVESNIGNQFRVGERIKDEKKINGFRNHVDARVLENDIIRNSTGMDRARVGGKSKPVDQNNVEKKLEAMDQARIDGKSKPLDQNNAEKKMEAKEKNKQNGCESKGEKHKDKDKEKRSKSKDKDRKKEKEKKEKVKKPEQSKELPKLKEGIKDLAGTSIVKPSNHLLKGNTKVSVEGNLGVFKEVEMKKESTKEQPKLKEESRLSPDTKTSSGEGNLGKREELEMKKEPIAKDSSKDMPGISIVKLSNHVKGGIKSSYSEGNLGKRKEPEMNGILHDNGIQPNKLPRLVSSFDRVMENGKKMGPSQIAVRVEAEKQGTASNLRVGLKGPRINGLVDSQPPDVSSRRPSHDTIQVNGNGELCGKPPHPDSKYLNQVLSVPKIEELSGFDDQEWLFGSNNLRSKKPKVGSPQDKMSQVWAETLQIESADIYALPYVIPY